MDFIDLRSDTVTWPTQAMRDAMHTAKVGDDVFEDDPTVNNLEARFAELVGKEASLFVPTGCMGNQICIFFHANKHPRGSELIAADEGHIVQYENGASALLAGLQIRSITTNDGIITRPMIEKKVRINVPVAEPRTALVVLENPTSSGTVMSLDDMKAVYELSRDLGFSVHLDGARVFNAAAHLNVDVKEITQYADTVMACLSKGLGAPIGSMVAGSKEFVSLARKYRKLFGKIIQKSIGGGLRQVGILAAAGMVSLEQILPQITHDNRIARHLAIELQKLPQLEVLIDKVQINMLFFRIPTLKKELYPQLQQFFGQKKIKILLPFSELKPFRFLTHHYIREPEVDVIIQTFKEFFVSQGL